MKVQLGPLTEPEVQRAREQNRQYADLLEMPSDSHTALIWTLAPVGEKTKTHPDGRLTGLVLVDAGMSLCCSVPTLELRGATGQNIALFGRILAEKDPERPTWELPFGAPGGNTFIQPWMIRVQKPDARVFAQIVWTPEIRKAHKSIEVDIADDGEWDDSAGDTKALAGAWQAMKFLHDFHRKVDGGRLRTPWEVKVDALATPGVKWFRSLLASGRSVAVEDYTRSLMGENTNRTRKAIEHHMTRTPKVVKADVHRRMHELLDESPDSGG